MDNIRMETLLRHIGRMDSTLADKLDRYKSFTAKEKPQIAVVCSEKLLFNEMTQLFTGFEQADITMYGAYDNADIIYDIMLSDAVIAVSGALRIAPVGIFEALDKISSVAKEIYFMLGGWGSIPRTKEQAATKSQKVIDSFPASNIRVVLNYYKESCKGFSLPDQAVNDLVALITNDAERLRSNQEERLYSILKSEVSGYYDKQQAVFDNQVTSVLNAKRLVQAKRDEYIVRLSHLSVNVQSITDKVMARASEIRISEIEYGNDVFDEDLQITYLSDKKCAEQVVKKRTATLIVKAFEAVKDEYDSFVTDSGKALESDCKGDMLAMVSRLKLNFDISPELIDELEKAAEDTQCVEYAANRYNKLVGKVIDAVKKKIGVIVQSYKFILKPSFNDRLRKGGNRLIEKINGVFDDSDGDSAVSSDSNAKEEYEEKQYDLFIQDTQQMLDSSMAQVLNLLQDNAIEIKKNIDDTSKEALIGYFTSLQTVLDKISSLLDKQKSTFSLE